MHLRPRGDTLVVPLEKLCHHLITAMQGTHTAPCGAAPLHGRCSQAQDVLHNKCPDAWRLGAAKHSWHLSCKMSVVGRPNGATLHSPNVLCPCLQAAIPVRVPLKPRCVQKDMPRNGDCPLVRLGRTGPVYVRLDGIPMIGHGAASSIATGQLQQLIKEDMCRQVAGVRGFEDVHIYSRPLNQPGYAIFLFDTEEGEPLKRDDDTSQILFSSDHRWMH